MERQENSMVVLNKCDKRRLRWALYSVCAFVLLVYAGACRRSGDAASSGSFAHSDNGSETASRDPSPLPPVATGAHGAVATAEAHATDVGLRVLQEGGNAVDAAVAVGFALGVTHPSAGNVGGGGFMVIRFPDGSSTAIDYRERAPMAASRNMYLDANGSVTQESRLGPKAAGVPGVVAGMWLAHERYGTKTWAQLVAPAVALARDGWPLDAFHAEDLANVVPRIQDYRASVPAENKPLLAALDATLATFQRSDGRGYQEGDVWKQPALAETLLAIQEGGQKAFYQGALANKMATQVAAMGGLWTEDDLAGYRAVIRKPVRFSYRGSEIISMPPPSAGGIVLRQVLAGAEALRLEQYPWDSVERIHHFAEALRRIYADRNQLIGDPDFVTIPLQELLNVDYMARRMSTIDSRHATPSADIGAGVQVKESEETTHFSIVDSSGMAVSNTYTLNGFFGAKVQIPGTGVTLNNEMDDFTAKVGAPNMFGLVQGEQNAIEPGKRMLSSMTPTIVATNGKLRAVLGSPGGPTISTTVAQILLQLLDYHRSIEEAVSASRVHHQWWPDQITHEARLSADLILGLTRLGHKLVPRNTIGHANCIEVTADGTLRAVADTERDGGKAAAY